MCRSEDRVQTEETTWGGGGGAGGCSPSVIYTSSYPTTNTSTAIIQPHNKSKQARVSFHPAPTTTTPRARARAPPRAPRTHPLADMRRISQDRTPGHISAHPPAPTRHIVPILGGHGFAHTVVVVVVVELVHEHVHGPLQAVGQFAVEMYVREAVGLGPGEAGEGRGFGLHEFFFSSGWL
ncbi:hypothetical protein FN846DRAFT_962106 [Sphaerosporella brunnea]|uniref:Uncharacterized protein n=1 Tax=Sphaerosporella brunnea TaxID=1250544 RepID=A0A5J5EP23_9PEZI|nr:hypothetical protein FN846DRAFT_962106 [Sphaerosporella brunnea]